MQDLSIIIANHNSKEYLDRCLSSVVKTASDISHEIILVDNASSDGSVKLVREKYPQVKVIENGENLGFSKASNKGIRSAAGKYIMLLNNDVLIKERALKKLVDFLRENSDAGAVGPKLLNIDGTIQHQCRRDFPTPMNAFFYFSGLGRLFPKNKSLNAYLRTYLDDEVVGAVDSLCGASMVVRKEAIKKIGLLDEDYFMYGEDLDWCYRIKKAGWKIYYQPQAEIVHYGGRTSRQNSYKNIYEFHKAMRLFYRKHYAGRRPRLVNWGVYLGIWLKYLVDLAKNFLRREKTVGSKKP
ncbi:glycosyltransferase family 2 protein [Candidatus Margulisiibacteriota bacterium]